MHLLRLIVALMFSMVMAGCAAAPQPPEPAPSATGAHQAASLPSHVPRFGRARPLVAVVGENSFTELTDYVVPYGVLHASGVADVVALGVKPGPIQMFPALRIRPHSTVDEFDARFPDGADYVIVPAVHRSDDAALLAWVASQAAKGASIVGVCDGVWVVAHAGLLKNRRAVGHWYSFGDLEKKFPDTTWLRDLRYVADGRIVTTTGVSASIPVSLALVEAMGGRERAQAVAQDLGVGEWHPAHRSRDFQLRAPHLYTAAVNWLSFWSHEVIGIPIADGVSDVALALAADAYSRTYRSSAVSVAPTAAEVRTRGGLWVVPDQTAGGPKPPHRRLPLPAHTKPAAALDWALRDIAETYGRATSAFVALQLEYPQP